MKNIIQEIRSEHATMARLLRVLEDQVAIFESAGHPDYELIQEVVLYFLDFPDQYHHPKEDILAQKLLSMAPSRTAELRGLAVKHEELGLLTRKVASVVEQILGEAELPRASLIQAAKEFIGSQRHHMEMEEKHFLPLAEEMLQQSDFDELASELFQMDDPLFGDSAAQHFAKLREDILMAERGAA